MIYEDRSPLGRGGGAMTTSNLWIEKFYDILSQTEFLLAIAKEKEGQIAALTTENKRLRQIVIDCHAGWPDEVLQQALRGKEERE